MLPFDVVESLREPREARAHVRLPPAQQETLAVSCSFQLSWVGFKGGMMAPRRRERKSLNGNAF